MKFRIKAAAFMILLLIFSSLFSTTILYEEDFSNPENWDLEGNWSITEDILRLNYSPTTNNYDFSATSPVISLPEETENFVINHHLKAYSAENEILSITILSENENYEIWTYQMLDGNWGDNEGSDLNLSLSDFAGENIQIEFRSYGNSTFNFNWWKIFNFRITGSFENDLAITDFSGPENLSPNQEGIWNIAVSNLGNEEQDFFTLELYNSENELLSTTNITEPIEPNEQISFDLSWIPQEIQSADIYAKLVSENDDFQANNVSESLFINITSPLAFNTILWDNDNNSTYVHPVEGNEVGCENGLSEVLTANGVNFDLVYNLPEDLTDYDIIFITLGLYCLG